MKSISIYIAEKYREYKNVEDGIFVEGNVYYLSFSFEQEPKYGEGSDAGDISQYPLEDILDKYMVYVSDFYRELNKSGKKKCYLEVASDNLSHIKQFKDIIGRHVYNKDYIEDGVEYVDLVIE